MTITGVRFLKPMCAQCQQPVEHFMIFFDETLGAAGGWRTTVKCHGEYEKSIVRALDIQELRGPVRLTVFEETVDKSQKVPIL